MNEIEQLKEDVRTGRIDANRLVDLMATVQRQLHAAQCQLQAANQLNTELQQRITELEK